MIGRYEHVVSADRVRRTVLPQPQPPPAVSLVLPAPPFLNDAYKCWRNRVVLSQEGKDYKAAVWAMARQHLNNAQLPLSHFHAPGRFRFPLFAKGVDVILYVAWHRAAKRGDLDGILKLLLDSLQGTVYHKDSQVAALVTWRVDGNTGKNRGWVTTPDYQIVGYPRVEIRVEPWTANRVPVVTG